MRFSRLPSEGFKGKVPAFPLARMRRHSWVIEGKVRYKRFDKDKTTAFREAEMALWRWAWRTPQASLWATPQWSWVRPAVADWCRLKALSAEEDAPVAVWAVIRQREGDILLSSDSLNRAGFVVAVDDLEAKRQETPVRQSSRDRIGALAPVKSPARRSASPKTG